MRRYGLAATAASVGLLLGTWPAHAQNAAQRAALARMDSQAQTGVEATSIALAQPGALAFDKSGDLYIADTDHNAIRKVDLNGVITTVAGTGEQGFAGDGGAATQAQLDSPAGVAIDAVGDIYIADTHNQRIREVVNGNISTIAGTGIAGFAGDGGAASSAEFNLPTAIALDSKGNLYIADTNNNRIREISGGNISTVAGNGDQSYSGDGGLATATGLDSPNGIAVDSAFNLYIGDTHNQRVRMVMASTGIISTLAGTGAKTFSGDGTASSAALARPRGVAVDATGAIYVADSDNQRIRVVANGKVTTVAGDGQEGFSGDKGVTTSASLDTPRTVAVNGQSIVFADTENNRIRSATGGAVNTVAGLAPKTAEQITIGGELSAVYGTGSLKATFSNGGNVATGSVSFYDGRGTGAALIASAPLSADVATLDTSSLAAGTHYIVASYLGDAKNAAVISGLYVLVVTPASVTGTANAVSMLYGQTPQTLAGTLSGVLPRDAANVSLQLTSTASATSNPGIYPISLSLQGSAAANYNLTVASTSGSVTIAKAPSAITLTGSTATPIQLAPFTLTATVASTTSGTPAGTVNFYNGATLLNAAPVAVANGIATVTTSTLPVGPMSLTAVYSGDADFTAVTSTVLQGTVLSPEFTIATGSPATQSVLPAQSAQYSINLTPVNPTFLYPVALSVSGLPDGVTAKFDPAGISVGSAATSTTLTLTADAHAQTTRPGVPPGAAAILALLLLPVGFTRRARRSVRNLRLLLVLLGLAVAGALSGCGAGGFFSHTVNSYDVTVTAISGPETHTTTVSLTVQ